jgi:RsiW-degrading membrane proteinase PrsW (M82 family)
MTIPAQQPASSSPVAGAPTVRYAPNPLTSKPRNAPATAHAPNPPTPVESPAANPPGVASAVWKAPPPAEDLPRTPAFAPLPQPTTLAAPSGGLRIRDRMYLVLLLAIVPLLIHTFTDTDDFQRRLKHTIHDNPQIGAMSENSSLDEVLDTIPEHRIEGATLARDSFAHWGLGAASAALFFTLGMILLRGKDSKPEALLLVGVFTGTLGVLMLIGLQYLAEWSQGIWISGFGIFSIFFYIVKFIGYSYRVADDPNSGLLRSFLGFTFAVGFCEEMCKAMPLLWHFRRRNTLSWRGACIWGLMSGAGFGVAEGIMYSSHYYNGIGTDEIYWVRFVSCVGLHAAWTAAAGVCLFRNRARLQGNRAFWEVLIWGAYVVFVPMILHGAYDAFLKQGFPIGAFALAALSFGWLAYQIERIAQDERRGLLLPASTPTPAPMQR